MKWEEFGFNKAWDFARKAQQKEREAKILEGLQKNDYNYGQWTLNQEKAKQVCEGGVRICERVAGPKVLSLGH